MTDLDPFHLVIEVSDFGLYDALLELFMRRDPTAIVSVNGVKQPLLEEAMLIPSRAIEKGRKPIPVIVVERKWATPPKEPITEPEAE